ncbi:hypothetical protein LSTR_LSTR015360 [Laodelphax striatellus]|uniref:Uncharacterized protein n=1 Tax=Laodelphax striatellus TaxID=195883 RepID=A0A482WIN7_LAOST|nr:hypothetical protein LSTR_LSTR015360 [Laodelphax striatellus]
MTFGKLEWIGERWFGFWEMRGGGGRGVGRSSKDHFRVCLFVSLVVTNCQLQQRLRFGRYHGQVRRGERPRVYNWLDTSHNIKCIH